MDDHARYKGMLKESEIDPQKINARLLLLHICTEEEFLEAFSAN